MLPFSLEPATLDRVASPGEMAEHLAKVEPGYGQKGGIFVPSRLLNRLLIAQGLPSLAIDELTRFLREARAIRNQRTLMGEKGWLIRPGFWKRHGLRRFQVRQEVEGPGAVEEDLAEEAAAVGVDPEEGSIDEDPPIILNCAAAVES
jgi:hypothetical protein